MSKRGVTCPHALHGIREPTGVAGRGVKTSPDVASKHGVTCQRGVREPGGVAGRGVKTWRELGGVA